MRLGHGARMMWLQLLRTRRRLRIRKTKVIMIFISESDVEIIPNQFNKTFKPIFSVSEWEEISTASKRISVALLLPTGVESDSISLHVSANGKKLVMDCQWPTVFTNVSDLHRKWLSEKAKDRIKEYHQKLAGFENFYKKMREKSSDVLVSRGSIVLPYAVETHIYGEHFLGWEESSAKAVYVELRAKAETYGMVAKKVEFEIY
ncbi:hypothetical protein FGB62_265g06 [Gracilaria domingensis]|nr:hypothetical protein FGB62_265g06 [Gracilaria domingensis]